MELAELVEDSPTVESGDFVTRVRKVMDREGIHELPVVEEGRVDGIIRQRDLLNVTSTKSNVTVKGYVEPAPELSTDLSPLEAADRMTNLEVDTAPVSGGDGRYVGTVTLASIFEAVDDGRRLSKKRVEEYMTSDVEAAAADDPVSKVWLRMMDTGYTGLPVLKDGDIIGIVTASDVMEEGHARVKRESRTGENARDSPPVESIMTTPVETVKRGDGVSSAFEKMRRKDIGRLPVINDDSLVGLIDRYDVLRAMEE